MKIFKTLPIEEMVRNCLRFSWQQKTTSIIIANKIVDIEPICNLIWHEESTVVQWMKSAMVTRSRHQTSFENGSKILIFQRGCQIRGISIDRCFISNDVNLIPELLNDILPALRSSPDNLTFFQK